MCQEILMWSRDADVSRDVVQSFIVQSFIVHSFIPNLIPSYPQKMPSCCGIKIKRLHNVTRILQCKVFMTLYHNASRLRPPPPRAGRPDKHYQWPPYGKLPRATMTRHLEGADFEGADFEGIPPKSVCRLADLGGNTS